MSSSGLPRKHRNDKQIQAIIFNMKEQRLLEKVYQALKLEETHSLKLLRLNYIDIKANQCRIENKVAKIRSHLTTADIVELKRLECEGKLGKDSSRTSNNALRIACASQRLKLSPTSLAPPGGRPQTARQPTDPSRGTMTPDVKRPTTSLSNRGRLSVSVDAAIGPRNATPSQGRRAPNDSTGEIRPSGKHEHSSGDGVAGSGQTQRPITSHGYGKGRPHRKVNERRPQTALCVMYSSHSVQESSPDGDRGQKNAKAMPSGMGSTMAKQQAKDSRRHLLDEERAVGERLEKRRQQFLVRTAKWVKESRAVADPDPRLLSSIRNLRNRNLIKRACALGKQMNLTNARALEDERRPNADDMWKDIRKCRYIRASDDQLDSSGVNTLASEQFLLLQRMRISDMPRRPRSVANRSLERK